jgi:hypothetical protein
MLYRVMSGFIFQIVFSLRYQLQIILRLEIQSMVHGGDQNTSVLEDKVEEVLFFYAFLYVLCTSVRTSHIWLVMSGFIF